MASLRWKQYRCSRCSACRSSDCRPCRCYCCRRRVGNCSGPDWLRPCSQTPSRLPAAWPVSRHHVPGWEDTAANRPKSSTQPWSSAPAAAETSTIVDVWPSSSVTFIVSAMPTSTFCEGSLVSAKPSLVTTRSYVPGGTVGNVNRPASFVVVFVVELVENSVSLTLAPGKAPPVWSVTCPTMTPVAAFCAKARATPRLRKIRMHTEKTFFEDLMLVPPGLKGIENLPAVFAYTGGHGTSAF